MLFKSYETILTCNFTCIEDLKAFDFLSNTATACFLGSREIDNLNEFKNSI